jgi:alpha-1,6-mannosyltransferase
VSRLHLLIAACGSAYLAAIIALAITEAPLGTPAFFICAAIAAAAYAGIIVIFWRSPPDRRYALTVAILFAIAFRVPLAVPRVNGDNDLMRYLWDGRVQKLGLNPYAVTPADPALAFTHTDDTRAMPSARARTPYPPAAQLFFRLVVSIHDSPRAMKLALVACDLLTMLVLWRWLGLTGRNEWLTIAYAWNPLVVLEIAHSGHIDALGALWITAAAFWLTRRRTALATVAFVLAVATKLLPIVLVPLLWRRITLRDAALGAGLFLLLYLPFASGTDVFFGVQSVVQHVRFNGPVFRYFAGLTSPDTAARLAVALGLLTAALCRWKLALDEPAAWAWPMAVAIACAPVVYPWYLLYLTPFLLGRTTIPLTVWSCTVLSTYVVWEIARQGGRWVVPAAVLGLEYLAVCASALPLLWWISSERRRLTVRAASPSTE